MKKVTNLLILCFLVSIVIGQENKYDLLLESGTVRPAANFDRLEMSRAKPDELISGKYFRIIQFLSIPTQEEKQELKSQGIELIGYLPNYAYFAYISGDANLSRANRRGNIRSLLTISPDYKIHPAIKDGMLPSHAEIAPGKADLILIAYKGITMSTVVSQLRTSIPGIEIQETDEAAQMLYVRAGKEQIGKIPALSFIAYVQAIDKWEVENNSGTTLHRSNTINTTIANGLRYDGTGVGVSVGDGSYFYSHVDFTGRASGAVTTTGSSYDHPTHVTGTVAGAGNINPKYKGQAPGANLVSKSGYADISSVSAITTLHDGTSKIRVTQHSLGQSCNGGYDANARLSDLEVESLPSLFSVHSAGNSGTQNCNYGAGSGWGNITGGYKMGKNCITTGNLAYTDAIASSSSRGPTKDGRIKPDICAKGSSVFSTMPGTGYASMSGTSMASPGASGCFAQLIHVYRDLNSGSDPKLGQLKNIVLNTAQDLGNPGPDYIYGWGRLNVWKAHQVIKNKQYASGSIMTGEKKTHTITVPSNVQQMKVMVYWADPAATAGVSKALINDIDMTLTSPSSTTYNPWVLSNTATATELSKPAATGQDRDNNMEQVVVNTPAAGTYTVTVDGYLLPMDPQEYWVSYDFITDDIMVTYPIGGEGFVPGETEYIRWDAYGTSGNFTVEYSTNGGTSWTVASSAVSGASRYYAWVVPNTLTGKAMIRVSRSGKDDASDANFSIIAVPASLKIDWRCQNSFQLSWNAVSGATSYEVYLLGQKYMESQGTTAATNFVVTSTNAAIRWASVRALADNGQTIGRRAIAIQVPTAVTACTVGINDYEEEQLLQVFPNPNDGTFEINLDIRTDSEYRIRIQNALGQTVYSKNLGHYRGQFKEQVDIAAYGKGIYLLTMEASGKLMSRKIVVY